MALGRILKTYITVDFLNGAATRKMKQTRLDAYTTAGAMDEAASSARPLAVTLSDVQYAYFGLAAASVAAAGGLYMMAKQGAQVDMLFAEMEATSGATAEQMQRVRDQANRLGAVLPTTLYEAADAFREMSYAGYSAEEAISASTGVVYLAETGALDMATAARVATSTLNAFRMEATKANAVANSLAGAFATSAVTIMEISHSLEYASAAAFQAGQSLTEVTAAIGLLGDVGLRASKAGVGLQQLFNRLADPTKKAQAALAELGLTAEDFVDMDGDFKDLYEIMLLLNEAFQDADFGKAEQLRILTSVFQTRGARAVAPLVNNVDRLKEKIEDVGAASVSGALADFATMDRQAKALREEMIAAQLDEIAPGGGLELEIGPRVNQRQFLTQLYNLRDQMDETQLTALIETSLQVDDRAARILASDIMEGDDAGGIDALITGLDNATTSAEITAAKMRTVGGQVEYLTGSLSAFAYVGYRQIEPFFHTVGRILIWFADAMTANAAVAKVFGLALLGLTAALITATGATAALAAVGMWNNAVQKENAFALAAVRVANYGAAVAAKVHAGAQYVLANGIWYSTGALYAHLQAKWANFTATLANIAVQNTFLYGLWGMAFAAYAAATGQWTLSAAMAQFTFWAGSAAAAVWALLAPFWPIIAVGLVLVGVWYLLKNGLLEWLGVADEVSMVAEYLGMVFRWLGAGVSLLIDTFMFLGGLAIMGLFMGIAGAVRGLIGVVAGVVNWFDRLGKVGKFVVGMMFPFLWIFWAASKAGGVLAAVFGGLASAGGALGERVAGLYRKFQLLAWVVGYGLGAAFEYLGGHLQGVIRYFQGLHRGAENVANGVIELFDAIENLDGDRFFQVGRNIVSGILRGFKSMAGTFGSILWSLVPSWARRAVKLAMGIGKKLYAPVGYNNVPPNATLTGSTGQQGMNVTQENHIQVSGVRDPDKAAKKAAENVPDVTDPIERDLDNNLPK